MPGVGTMLESQFPDDWGAARRNAETTEKHLRPALPNAKAYNNANISVANGGSGQILTLNSEWWDEGDLHSTSADTGRLTAPITGLYHVGGSVRWATNATGVRQMNLRKNGSTLLDVSVVPGSASVVAINKVSAIVRLAKGEYVDALVFQNSGGALDAELDGEYSPVLWAYRRGGYTNEGVA